MLTFIIVLLVVTLLPAAFFFGLIGLALFIWSWNRIGRYFVNFGRWMANWRNFIPLAGCGTLGLLVLLVLLAILPQLKLAWTVLLILNLIVAFVSTTFALIMWIVALCQWVWPRYRKSVWQFFGWLWNLLWRAQPASGKRSRHGGTPPPARPQTEPPPDEQPALPDDRSPRKRSWLGAFWALMMGEPPQTGKAKPQHGARSQAGPQAESRVRPPEKAAKGSWFSRFWALMIGKPAKPARPKPEAVRVETTEQSVGPSVTAHSVPNAPAARMPAASTTVRDRKTPPKGSWFSRFWALMIGKPAKPAKPRLQPVRVESTEQSDVTSATRSGISDPPPAMPVASTPAQSDRKTKTSLFSRFRALIIGKRAKPAKPKARATKSPGSSKAKHTPDAAAKPLPIPRADKKQEPAKKGLFGRIWAKIVRGFTFVVGMIFLAVLWLVQRLREAVEWVRMKLNLD